MTILACLFALVIKSIGAENLMAVDVLGKFPNVPENMTALEVLWHPKTLIANFGLLFTGWPYFDMMGINNPTWYCCVLLQCYLVFWIVALSFNKIAPKYCRGKIWGMIVVLSIILGKLKVIQFSTFRGIEAFFIGVLLCEYFLLQDAAKKKFRRHKLDTIACTLLVLSVIAIIIVPSQQRRIFLAMMFPAMLVLAIKNAFILPELHALHSEEDNHSREYGFNNSVEAYRWERKVRKIIEIASAISFEVFIWHAPLMAAEKTLLRLEIPAPQRSYCSMLMFTVIVWLWSWIMFVLVEKPVKKFIEKNITGMKK